MRILRELYGAGILFFYYIKYFVIIGYPLLVYGAGYSRTTAVDIFWLYCTVLMIKDIVYRFVLKKSYCKI